MLVEQHFQNIHTLKLPGLEKTWSLNTPEKIEEWRQERRKKFPKSEDVKKASDEREKKHKEFIDRKQKKNDDMMMQAAERHMKMLEQQQAYAVRVMQEEEKKKNGDPVLGDSENEKDVIPEENNFKTENIADKEEDFDCWDAPEDLVGYLTVPKPSDSQNNDSRTTTPVKIFDSTPKNVEIIDPKSESTPTTPVFTKPANPKFDSSGFKIKTTEETVTVTIRSAPKTEPELKSDKPEPPKHEQILFVPDRFMNEESENLKQWPPNGFSIQDDLGLARPDHHTLKLFRTDRKGYKKVGPTLLQSLLKTDIQRERNILIQCVEHTVTNKFYQENV